MARTEEPSDSGAGITTRRTDVKSPRARFPGRIYLPVGFVAALIAATMGYSLHTGGRMTEVYAPLVDAAMGIKFEAALGHLWFEEVISGDRREDITNVWEHLDRSAWYARAMLEGGQSPEGTLVPLEDPELRREIEHVLRKIADFRAIAEERYAIWDQAAAGTDIDQRFDAVFEDFLAQAGRVKTSLQLLMASELQRFRTVQAILIGVCVGLAAIVAVLLSRYDQARARALPALRESEERYRAIAEDTPVLICRFLPGGEITYVNDAYCRYFEKTPDELVGQTFPSLIPEADREPVMANISALTVETPTQSHEHQVFAPGGEIQWQRWTNRGLFDAQGKAVAYQSVGEDITERRRAEEALRKSESKMQSVFRVAPTGIGVVIDRVLKQVNERMCQMTGYSEEELIDQNARMLYPSDEDYEYVGREKYAQIRDHGTGTVKTRWRCKDGRTIDVLLSSTPMDLDDLSKGVTFTALDITDRKRAEDALRESERLLLESQSVAQVGSYVLDIPSGTWESSPILDRIFGIGEDYERSVESWLAIVHPEDRQSMADYFAHDVIAGHGRFDKEYRVVRHDDGIERWVLGLGKLEFDARSRPVSMVGTIQDITERKRAEEALHRSEHIVSSSTDMLALLDKEFVYLAANPAYVEAFGIKPKELVGHTAADIFGKEFFDTTIRPNAERCLAGEEVHYEGWFEFPVSGRKYMDIAYFPYIGVDKEVNGFAVCGRDITERKRAEETSKQQQYYLERAQELGRIGTWELDLSRNKLYWTDENCRIFGVPAGSVVNYEVFLGKVHPDDREYVDREWNAALDGKAYDIEHRIVVDDITKWVREKADVEFDEEGEAISAIGITQDITERKRAEEALRRQREELEIILDSVPAAVFYKDRKNRLIRVNKALADAAGMTKAEMEGTSLFDLYPDVAEDYWRDDKEVMASGQPKRNIIEPLQTPRGTRWLNTDKVPYVDEDGDIIGVIGFSLDITARKQAEEAQARLATAIEQAGETVVITDAEGTIQYANPAFERITGYSREEALGQNPRILKSGEQDDAFYKELWNTLTRGETWRGRFTNKRKDGTLFEEEASISPIRDTTGKIVNYDDVKIGYDNNDDDDVGDDGDDVQIDDAFASSVIDLSTDCYDHNGNLTDDGLHKYVYDAWNRLVKVTRRVDAEDTVATYAYDGLNRRITRTVTNCGPEEIANDGGNTVQHMYDTGWRLIETRNGSDQTTAQFVYGTQYIDELVAYDRDDDDDGDCIESGGSTRYTYHQDANFRTVMLTDEDGDVVERYEYTAYGYPLIFEGEDANGDEMGNPLLTSSVGNPFMHQGLYFDAETRTYQNRFRQYDPTLGRFLQRDPIGYFAGMNLYEYVGSNPLLWLDPLGLCSELSGPPDSLDPPPSPCRKTSQSLSDPSHSIPISTTTPYASRYRSTTHPW